MGPNFQVFYVMSGTPHVPYFLVSIDSLRKAMPDIDVLVYAWPESYDVISRISEDPRLRFKVIKWEPAYRGKNCQFICKMRCGQHPSANVKLYLDGDTMVMGDLTPLLLLAESNGFCATQFNDWTTQGTVKKRVARLLDREGIPQDKVKALIEQPYPSVNGGVFACRPESPVVEEWHRRTNLVRDLFIADEIVLHTFVADPDEFPISIARTGLTCWNCSPKYAPSYVTNINVWHFHGDSNVRPQKSQRGYDLWWPEWQRCFKDNIGFVQEWKDSIRNKWMIQLEEKNK